MSTNRRTFLSWLAGIPVIGAAFKLADPDDESPFTFAGVDMAAPGTESYSAWQPNPLAFVGWWIPVTERVPHNEPGSGWHEYLGVVPSAVDGKPCVTAVNRICHHNEEERWHEPGVMFWAELPQPPTT